MPIKQPQILSSKQSDTNHKNQLSIMGKAYIEPKKKTTVKRRELSDTLTERGEGEMGEGKAGALMWDAKFGAIRERVMNGGLWNEFGEVWRRRAAVIERRWWWCG